MTSILNDMNCKLYQSSNDSTRVHKRPFDYDTFSEAQNMVNEPQVNGG